MSASSQSTGLNYLVRNFGSGNASLTFRAWVKVNSFNKAGSSNDFAFSIDNASYGDGYRQSAYLGEGADGTPAVHNFGTWASGINVGQNTTYGVITATGVWTFVAVTMTATNVTFYSGGTTGALTSSSFTPPAGASAMTQVVLASQLFPSYEFPGHISVRGAALWLGQVLDATQLTAERDSATFAPVYTTGLDSYLALVDGTNPEVAITGTNWIRGGTWATDSSDPSVGGSAAHTAALVEAGWVLSATASFPSSGVDSVLAKRRRPAPVAYSDSRPPKLSARVVLPLWSVDMPPGVGWGVYPDNTPTSSTPRRLRATPAVFASAASADHVAALVEAGWTLAASQSVSADNTGALTEASWSVTATQSVAVDHSASLAESGWVLSAAQTATVDHLAALVESGFVAAGSQGVESPHSAALAEAGWVLSAAGAFFAPGADHSAALVEAGWVLAASQDVNVNNVASLTDVGFVAVASQGVAVDHAAALAEAGWVVSASGSFVGPGVDHTAALVEASWTLAASQSVSLDHVAALVEAGWTAAATQAVLVNHAAALAEAGWVLAATGAFSGPGGGPADHTAALVEASWVLSASQGESVDHTAALVEAGWYGSGNRVFGRLHIHVRKDTKPTP